MLTVAMQTDENEDVFIPVSQRTDAPLAGILRPEYQDIDPR